MFFGHGLGLEVPSMGFWLVPFHDCNTVLPVLIALSCLRDCIKLPKCRHSIALLYALNCHYLAQQNICINC